VISERGSKCVYLAYYLRFVNTLRFRGLLQRLSSCVANTFAMAYSPRKLPREHKLPLRWRPKETDLLFSRV
jgi:hypothetical protein